MMVKNIENTLEKALKDAYREGYATGWGDALQTAAALLGRIAKQRKYADANRWINARREDPSHPFADDVMMGERSEE